MLCGGGLGLLSACLRNHPRAPPLPAIHFAALGCEMPMAEKSELPAELWGKVAVDGRWLICHSLLGA